MFGDKKRIEELEAQVAWLQAWVQKLRGYEAQQIARAIEDRQRQLGAVEAKLAAVTADLEIADAIRDWQSHVAELQAQAADVNEDLERARAEVIQTDEIALLQEVGIYQYRHPLDDAVAYQSRLKSTKDELKALVKDGRAVDAATDWTVNGSPREGGKMVRDLSKLMLRAYNAEADNIVRTLRPHTLASAISRLGKARETIAKLGAVVHLRITEQYHAKRVYELELTADYLVKVEEEKERLREQRARQREEERALREMEAEKERLRKEEAHYRSVLERLLATGQQDEVGGLEKKLAEVQAAIGGIEYREANIRAGYVYVISNFGSFGDQVVKIGLTRRLEPKERVRELGDASVPFNFDIHALIFDEDAVGLEARLHSHFADRRVNRVNQRREFFYVTPSEVRDVLASLKGPQLLEFRDVPEATDWRASLPLATDGRVVTSPTDMPGPSALDPRVEDARTSAGA